LGWQAWEDLQNIMSQGVIHVVFGASAAESLREALAEDDRREEIVSSDDSFALGPIAPADAAGRARWIDNMLRVDDSLGFEGWDSVAADNAPLLTASIGTDSRPVVWFSRRDARSYANFLWWLSHLGEAPCEIVDVTETMVAGHAVGGELQPPRRAGSPGLLPPGDMIYVREQARPLLPAERRRYQAHWQRLVQENAPLRVIRDGELVSHWRKMSRIVGETMGRFYEEEVYQCSDMLLFARLRHLAEAGMVDCAGDPNTIYYCEMRQLGSSDS